MVRLGQPVLGAVLAADLVEAVDAEGLGPSITITQQICALDAVVGKSGVEVIRHGLQKRDCGGPICLLVQLNEGKLRRAVDPDNEVRLAFLGADISDVDVEFDNRLNLKLLLGRLVATDLGQPTDAMSLQTAVRR